MDKKKELFKNTVIIFIGKICTQMMSFFLLPLYTSYLITSDYGLIDLIITYISLLVPIITLQTEMAAFRFLIDAKSEHDKKNVISAIIQIIIPMIILFATLFIILNSVLKISYGYLILLNIIIAMISSILLQVSRGMGQNIKYAVGSFISGSVTIVLNIVTVVFMRLGPIGILISMAVANTMNILYLGWSLKIYKYIDLKTKDTECKKKLLHYSLPLIPNGISWWIVNVSDRTIISIILGISKNGIYAVSNKFSTVFLGLTSVFNLAWTESASRNIDSDNRDSYFSEVFNISIKLFASICILLITFMPIIFNLFVASNYKDAYWYVPILLIATLCNTIVSLYSGVYIAKKMTKQVMNTSLLAAIINIVINLVLIRFIGLYAAAISTFVSYFAMMIYRYFDLKKYVTIKYDSKMIIGISTFIVIIVINYYLNISLLNIIAMVLSVIYTIYINRNIIFKIIRRGDIYEKSN